MKVVSSVRFPLLACLALVGVCVPSKAFEPSGEVKVLPQVPGIFERFGYSAAMSGDTVVIGTPLDSFGAGAAYVFVRNGSSWNQEAKLIASDTVLGAEFGNAVAIDGDTVVVGAHHDPEGGSSAGAAYVFVRQAGVWSQQAKLVPADAASEKSFGTSVDVSGESVAIGAIRDAFSGFDSGAVYVFDRATSTWSQHAKLFSASPSVGDLFGFAVSLDGSSLAVGSPFADAGMALDAGSITVLRRGVVGWSVETTLTASTPASNGQLGWAVSLSGDSLVGGAPGQSGQGAAFAFSRSGTSWSQTSDLHPSSSDPDQLFGYSVGLDGSELVVGCPLDNGVAALGGAAYFYHQVGSAWVLDDSISASDVAENDQFGFSVALDGRQAVVGTPFKGGMEQGAGYIYSAAANTPPQADPKSVVTDQDVPVAITLTGTDPEGATLTFSVASGPTQGSLSGTPPQITYTPNLGISGSDSFTYTVNDGTFDSPPATVSITILPAKAPPTADPQSVTTDEDNAVAIVLTGSSSDGSPILYGIVNHPSNGTLAGTPPNLVYTPAANWNGSDSFTFRVVDGDLVSTPATVSIAVNPVNDPPTIDPIPNQVGTVGVPVGPITIRVADLDDDVSTLQLTGESDNQELVPDSSLVFAGSGAQRSLTIQLPTQQTGNATIVVTVSDARSSSSTAFLLVVQLSNHAPVADASATLRFFITSDPAGAQVVLDGSRSSDADGDLLSYLWSANGQVFAQGPVTSSTLALGSHTLTLMVSDGLATDSDTFEVEVISSIDAIHQLIEAIQASALPDSVKTELIASLQNAAKLAAKGNWTPVDKVLAAVENKISAQVGKKITPAQAAVLLDAIAAIRASLP